MHKSAMLKIGKLTKSNLIKSRTYPKLSLSTKFPIVPPRTRPHAIVLTKFRDLYVLTKYTEIEIITNTENIARNKVLFSNIPNAAPVL